MKRLTLNRVARSTLRVNKKAYISLFMGILMAVYLATATSLCAWGTIRGHEEQMAEKVGWADMFLPGNDGATDEQIRSTGYFRKIGHITVDATVDGSSICTGWYDETANELMNRKLLEGRMPEKAGEIAAERSALIRLDLENTAVGETVTLKMKPIYGVTEVKTFTLVGILNEQTDNLDTFSDEEGMRFPAMLVSPAPVPERTISALKQGCTPSLSDQASRSSPMRSPVPAMTSREAVRKYMPLIPHLIRTVLHPIAMSLSAMGFTSRSKSMSAVMSSRSERRLS